MDSSSADKEDDIEVLVEDKLYDPDPRDVLRYASFMGVDLMLVPDLYCVVADALKLPLPPGYIACRRRRTSEGRNSIFYCSELSGESVWEHPLDPYHREVFALFVDSFQTGEMRKAAQLRVNELHAVLEENHKIFCQSLLQRSGAGKASDHSRKFLVAAGTTSSERELRGHRRPRRSLFRFVIVRMVMLVVVHFSVTYFVYTRLRLYLVTLGVPREARLEGAIPQAVAVRDTASASRFNKFSEL